MKQVMAWLCICGAAFIGGAVLAGYGLWTAVKALVPEPTPTT